MRDNAKLSGLLFPFLLISACAINSGINGTVKPHPNHVDIYLVYFRYSPFINEYTPGWDELRREVALADSIDNKLAVWQNAIRKSMPIYLRENGMIPEKCVHGIEVIDSNQHRGGGGVAAFKCRE